MYNLRYHIASLVAVFLALAVGLLLGSVVAEQGMITEQTASLIDDLEQRFDEISATNDQLSVSLERDKSFAGAAVVPLTSGRLEGSDVVVISLGGSIDGTNSVVDVITAAGGTPLALSLLTPGLALEETEPEGLAGYFQLRGVEMAEAGEELQQQVAEALIDEWRGGESRELTELLAGEGLLDAASMTGTATVDAVVVLGSGEAGCDVFALALARAMQAEGGVGVGADLTAVDGGTAAICAAQGLSAVDHVATPQGRVSLVWLLSGRASGYYGFGESAQGQFPPLE